MSVRSFLQTLKQKLDSTGIKPLRFVTGNQSADLDSVISAISYSYLNYRKDSTLSIPLINIPRNDFKLRRDIKLVLENHSITEDLLYFIEDFEKFGSLQASSIAITLVDHCNLQGETLNSYNEQGKLRVVSIIDHHEDEHVFLDAQPRIIKPNGSCSSLIFNYWYEQLGKEVSLFQESDSEIIKLLLAPLLIDTSNLSSKVEDGDRLSISIYKEILNPGISINLVDDFSLDYFKTIKTAKKDLSGFKVNEILRKDYKQFKFNGINVGFSSIGKSLLWLFKSYSTKEILEGVDDVVSFYHLDLIIVTPSYTDKTGQFRRELIMLYNKDFEDKAILDSLHQKVETLQLDSNVLNQSKFEEALKELNKHKAVKAFNQGNLAASRKQIVPAFKNAFESLYT